MCEWLRLNAPVIAQLEPEAALEQILDWHECELIEDPDTTMITLRGKTADVDPAAYGWNKDSLFEGGNDPIVKRCIVADLERTIKRWRGMARVIERVTVN